MSTHAQISEEEILKAIYKFQMEGGLIKKLPDEVNLRIHLVGQKYGRYETFFDNNFGLEDGFSTF